MTSVTSIGPIPQIGYGTWQRDGDEARRCVLWALEAGYRHLDTAEGYGNEAFVGKALAESDVARDAIFLTTKVAPDHLGPGQVMAHAKASLDRLGTDHVDLLLVHWPAVGDRYAMEDYLGQFAEVQDAGLTRHIGVSNFTRRHVDRALGILGGRPIVTNQVDPRLHAEPVDRRALPGQGHPATAYAPLARGAVAGNPGLEAIAAAHGATPAQVALAFLLAEGTHRDPDVEQPGADRREPGGEGRGARCRRDRADPRARRGAAPRQRRLGAGLGHLSRLAARLPSGREGPTGGTS